MSHLILVRHGKTLWNTEGRFTGQTDIPLSDLGKEEARKAGDKLKEFAITKVHTSLLSRSIETARIILETTQHAIPLEPFGALNERHYGLLQGKSHAEIIAEHGETQVKLWRRSFDARPPEGESLSDTATRVHRHFEENILHELTLGNTVLVCAHHNSLRALVMKLEGLGPEEITTLEIPTGIPLIYSFLKDHSFFKQTK
jgi:2,3-bisphosphoglycerate-dependent phosphoglycerate mutase